ncbi:MAG TPA: hypothetical protein VF588_01550 [Pyrinomonadaceae bacterium]|jgi:hypothetical protein
MRKTLSVAALMLALCCPALAGEVHIPPAPQPPPQTATTAPEPTDAEQAGIIPNDVLMQTALDLLALLPRLI